MGLDIVDQIKQAVSGGYDSSSGSDGSNSSVSIGRDSGGGRVDSTGGSSSNRNNPLINGGLHSDISRQSSSRDNSAYWSGEREERHNVNPLYSAASNANQNYQNALNAINDYVSQNSGYVTDDLSRSYYEQDLARLQQNLADAQRTRDMFTPSTESYAPSYKSSDDLNGGVYGTPKTSNPYGNYYTPEQTYEDRRAAAQAAADAANARGQSRTNYLKTYMTEDSNWTKSKYLTPESSVPDPNKPYEYDYQYMSPDELRQMDANDAMSPNWSMGKTWQQADEENYQQRLAADDDGVLRKAGASKYLADPNISEEDLKSSLMKPVNWLVDTAKNAWDGFVDGLTPTHVDVDSDTKRDYANRLIDYIEQGYGTEDIKKAAAGDAQFLDWLDFIKPFEASGNSKAAMTKTYDDIVAYDMKTGANALGYKSIDDAREGYERNKDKNKDYDKVESVERMKTEDPEMYAKYSKMSPAQQAIYRVLQSAKGGLAGLGNAMANFVAKGGSEVSKAAENAMFSLNTTPAQSAVYIIANGGLPKNGILKNGQVSEFTQEQWDNMAPSDKARLEKFYGIDSLAEFNKTLRELNYNIGVSSTFNEYYESKRDEVVEATKPIREYANVKAYEASYGLNGVAKLGVELVPSAIGMMFDAVVGGLPAMGMRVFGDAYSRAIDKGVDDQRATLYALASTAVEVGTELIGGESVVNATVYKNKGIFNSGAEAIIGSIDNTTMQRIALAAIGGLEEGLEEDMSQLCEPLVEALLETDFFQAVKEGYGEQRAADYAWAALGGALMSIAGAPVTDVITSISNRAAEAKGNFTPMNIDGTTRESNPNGRAAYSQSGQQIAQINQRKAIAGNPLAMAAYEQSIKGGASEDEARSAATYVHDSTSTLTPEQKKTYANDQDKFNADVDAFQEHRDEFKNAEVGDVVLDINNNEVGTVTKADDNGITVELTNADGEKTTEEVKFVGNNGVLDADSDLAKALGKYNEGTIVNAEEAKVFAQEAAARRKAQEEAKAAAPAQMETDSGTGTVAKPQQPTKKAPTPGKPASRESTDSGTGTVQKENAPKRTYQDILKDIEDVNKQIAEAEDPAVRNGLISKRAELWKERNATPEAQEELRKYEDELREKQQKEQEEEAAKRKEAADKKKAEDAEFEKTLEGLSEEEKDKKRRERRAEQQYQDTTNEDRKALDRQKYEQHKEQIENLKNGDILYNQYGDPIAKVTTKGNGRYTFTMLQHDGTETTTFGYAYNGHFDGGTWTTLWQEFDDGLTTEAAQPETNPAESGKEGAQALTDAATGKKPNTSEMAPESPVSASPETGNSVPESDQKQPQAPNETLNTGSEEDAAPATDENVEIKPYQNDDGSLITDAAKVAEVVKGLSQDELTEAFFAYGEHGNDGKYSAARDAINRELNNRRKNRGSGIRAKEDLGESGKTQKRETVPAETLEKALYGAADVGAARYEGTLNAKQVAKLSATQVIQRLQNYARKAGTSIKGLLKYITTDETGEPLVSNQSHTKQLIDSTVSGTIGQNVNGEFEDEVDVVGGEDDTRKERKKQSVEEAQEEANEIIRSNLELIGDSIRDATKADRSKYPAGLDGICDWILDSGRKRGIMPTKAEYDAFRQLVKNLLNDEFHRQNHWAKDKNGNVKDINWKKFTAVDALRLIDNMLADKANLENLSDADFTEINALLERAGNIDVGYGEYRKALGDTYIGRVSLADILAGDERFEEKLPDSEIYGNTNLTAGEKWVKDKNGNEVKVSDEEGWKENSKEETTDNALDGMTELEREEYEDAYWVKNGARDVANMFAQKSNTGTGNGAIVTILPTEVNGKTNPRLTGTEKSRKSISTYLSNGRSYIIQVGNNMFRHIIDSDISPRIKSVIDKHKQNVKTLQERIANGEAQKSQLSPALGDRIKKWDAKIAKLQEQLSIEQAWLEKLTKGWDKGKGENETYTLNDFLSDDTKDAFGKNLISQEEKDSIGVKTFINPKTGFSDVVYGGFKFDALSKAKSRDFAREIIDGIKRGVENGELAEHGYFGSRETDSLANRSGVTITESGNYTNSGYYGEQSPADARAEQKQREEQELQNQSGYSGVGNVVDDYGTVRQVSGTTGSRQGRRPLKGTQISRAAQEATTSINDFSEPAQLTIRPKGSKPGATIAAKWLGGNIYLDGEATGEINPESYRDNNNPDSERLVRVAGAIRDAAAEAGLAIVQINGQIYSTHTDENGEQFTNRTSAIAELSEGYIAISQITDESAGELILDTIHEIMHEHTTNQFGMDSGALLDFIDELSNKSGVNIKAKAQKVIAAYSEDGVTFDASCADEMISRIAEGHDCNGNFTAEEVEKLQDALFSSPMLEIVTDNAPATVALLNYSRTQARNKATPANPFVNKPATDVGYTPSTAEQEERISGIVRGEDVFSTKESKQSIDLYNFKAGLGGNQTERANPERLNRPTEQEALATKKNPLLRRKEDLDVWTDETFDSLIAEENARAAAALGEGTPIDLSDMDTLVNEASADEEALLNSRGGNVSAEDTGRFNNLVDQASASERETLNDLRNDSEDITNASEGAFDNLVEAVNMSEEEVLNAAAESSANQYPERRFKDAKDYYGKAYDEVVSKVATRHARNNSRSSFTHEDIYNKLYGNTPNARNNFRRLQKLNTNIDSLLKGKMSAQAFNGFIKNMMGEQGIGQIVNDDIQREFSELAKLEEEATGENRHDSDVINFQYAAADAVAHLCARMDMVEKTERARAKLDTLAKEHGKTNKNAIGNALDWYNRMQITGDNFWRMAGNWDAASRNQGYALAQEHNKAIATRISEEAKLKDYFSGIDKNSKQFRDFANGTTMSNVDFEGHKISLMEAVKFVKICDTMRAFANENRRPDWQRVAALGGFAFEGKDGKPVFVDIQGSKKNGGAERVQWVQDHYDAAMAEIQANKAASEYMKACEEMYWDAGQTAEKVHSKVNGYERYMYGKGKYTDIHYANKDGAVDFSYKDRDAIDVHDTGIMQKRTRVNGGYVICNPMSRSIDAYISQISNYIAFEEFGQKLGVLNDSKSINGNYANTVGDAYGSQYSKWFDNYVKSMTLYRETDPTKFKDKALAKARQAMMSGALVGSVSVPIKQVSSFFDTIGMLDPMAVAKAFGKNPLGLKQKGINNYLYKSRGQSISDPDFAELFGKNGLLGKIGNNPVVKLAKSATNMMDEKAVSNVYMACVYDTEMNTMPADKLYKNGKNFNDGLTTEGQFYVDSKFEQVLLGTQPIFTPQARNELARTDNQWLRMLQTFRTQQTQNYNRMLQTWNEYQAADGSTKGEAFNKFAQTMGGQVLASASLAALTAIANGVLHKHRRYKDDDDELDEEKFGKKFLYGMVESMTGNALFAGDITKWAIDAYNKRTSGNWDWRYSSKEGQYFSLYNRGINVPILSSGAVGTALQVISSAINLYDDVQKNGWDDTNILSARYLAGNMTTALGVPANNVYNALNAGYQWYNDLAYKITGDKKYEHKYDDFITQYIKVDNNQQNRLVNAILSNNTDKIDDMFENMGQDKFANAVYYGALDRYKSGKIDRDEYIDMLVDYGGKSYKDAVKDVDKKINLIESGISQFNGIDGRDGRKAFYDQYSDNFKSKDAFKQFFTDVKDGKAEGKHHAYYTTWNGQQQEVTANQSSIIDRMNENMAAGNFDYNTAKLLWENYYGYSTYKGGAWQYVGKW